MNYAICSSSFEIQKMYETLATACVRWPAFSMWRTRGTRWLCRAEWAACPTRLTSLCRWLMGERSQITLFLWRSDEGKIARTGPSWSVVQPGQTDSFLNLCFWDEESEKPYLNHLTSHQNQARDLEALQKLHYYYKAVCRLCHQLVWAIGSIRADKRTRVHKQG